MNTITTYARNAQDVLARTGRSSFVVGWGVPPEVHYQDGKKLEILKSYSTLPSEVKTRLEILQKGGVKYTQVLIAHELQKKEQKPLEISQEVVDIISDFLPVLASITVTLAKIVGAVLLLAGRVFFTLVLLDPVVIVVLEDGTWLEIAKWYD